jgi:hypothetical protein
MGIFAIASSILGQLSSANSPNPNKQQFKQGFQLLGQDLQSGNLSAAQQAYSSLQQDLQRFAPNTSSPPSAASGANLSVSA